MIHLYPALSKKDINNICVLIPAMSIELTNQHNLDTLLTTLKNYKRNNDKLLATISSSPSKSAEIHLLQEQS